MRCVPKQSMRLLVEAQVSSMLLHCSVPQSCLLSARMQKEKEKGGPSNASQLAAAFNKSSMMASLGFGSRASANKETLTSASDTAGVSKVSGKAAFVQGC